MTRGINRAALTAAAFMAGFAGMGAGQPAQSEQQVVQAGQNAARQQSTKPPARGVLPSTMASIFGGRTGRNVKRPRGKANAHSVAQGRRMARKARNQKAYRAACKGKR